MKSEINTKFLTIITVVLLFLILLLCNALAANSTKRLKPFEHLIPLKLPNTTQSCAMVPGQQLAPMLDGSVWPSGKSFDINQLKNKVVFLTITQTWCPSCRAAWPNLIDLYDQYKSYRSFRMVALIVDDGILEEPMNNWLKENPAEFIILIARNSKKIKYPSVFSELWGVTEYPANFLINKNGVVQYFNVKGFATKQLLDQLLGINK